MIKLEDVPEDQKRMIALKYDLKKIQSHFNCERDQVSRLKKAAGVNGNRRHNYKKKILSTFSPIPTIKHRGESFAEECDRVGCKL